MVSAARETWFFFRLIFFLSCLLWSFKAGRSVRQPYMLVGTGCQVVPSYAHQMWYHGESEERILSLLLSIFLSLSLSRTHLRIDIGVSKKYTDVSTIFSKNTHSSFAVFEVRVATWLSKHQHLRPDIATVSVSVCARWCSFGALVFLFSNLFFTLLPVPHGASANHCRTRTKNSNSYSSKQNRTEPKWTFS